jgi:hypothetical protein
MCPDTGQEQLYIAGSHMRNHARKSFFLAHGVYEDYFFDTSHDSLNECTTSLKMTVVYVNSSINRVRNVVDKQYQVNVISIAKFGRVYKL